ncbi:MAG TPA: cell envelope integrity protein TolA [Candidatus Tenderia electrophaga]|uniref:Cell envelope integrity protein TolA n=1 Tax=Candidatus Tenderia electrophaga TaxID=1748243 RepID=A0A832J3X1_9GAMM|nr:cell envelope integrity protein TolA [Candidatus Tenderia electrophaga]
MLTILRQNPRAFVFAIAVHLLLIAALSFNIDWNSKQKLSAPKANVIQAVMIDESKIKAEERRLEQEKRRQDELKKKKEAEKKRKAEQEKKRKAEQEKRRKQAEADKKRKQAELKKKQAAEKKRKAEQDKKRKAEAKRKKAEAEKKRKAELKKKQQAEKKRKQAELKKKQAAEKKRLAELEKKRQAEAERLRKLEEQRKADEQRRAEEEMIRQQQIAEEEAAMQAVRERALRDERSRIIGKIQQRVSSKWARPSGWRAGTSCTVTVRLVPGAGTARVIDARMIKSCGNPLFDRSVENAVFSASPLPFPTSPELMDEFREISFDFRPED